MPFPLGSWGRCTSTIAGALCILGNTVLQPKHARVSQKRIMSSLMGTHKPHIIPTYLCRVPPLHNVTLEVLWKARQQLFVVDAGKCLECTLDRKEIMNNCDGKIGFLLVQDAQQLKGPSNIPNELWWCYKTLLVQSQQSGMAIRIRDAQGL